MSTDLSPSNEQYIEDAVARGVFHSRTQALDTAVELLKRREETIRQVNQGIEELERGEGRPLNLEDVKADIRRRLAEESEPK
jgi:Arc/MetJ-type ribon-helix-helix transcriptional regulator